MTRTAKYKLRLHTYIFLATTRDGKKGKIRKHGTSAANARDRITNHFLRENAQLLTRQVNNMPCQLWYFEGGDSAMLANFDTLVKMLPVVPSPFGQE